MISQEEFQDKFTKNLDGLPIFQRKEIERRNELPEKIRRIEEKQAGEEPEGTEKINVILSSFLDAETYANKIDILRRNKDELDGRTLRNIAICLDLSFNDETDLYDYIMRHLDLRKKYEGDRLR